MLRVVLVILGVVVWVVPLIWASIRANRAYIRYVRLYRLLADPDFPLIGWPVEPGWRENTPPNKYNYSKNWTFDTYFMTTRILWRQQSNPELEQARQQYWAARRHTFAALFGGSVVFFAILLIYSRI